MTTQHRLSQHDISILRHLADRKLEIASDPVNHERRQAWYALDAGVNHRVMVLAEHGGVRDAKRPYSDAECLCEDTWARGVESGLRQEIFQFEVLRDDHVVEPVINVNWKVTTSDYGVPVEMRYSDEGVTLGARVWDSPIKDLDRDFDKLRPREFSVDREVTLAEKARLDAVFAGLLPARIRGTFYWTLGMTWTLIELMGMEQMMVAMYDNPDGLHRMMAFLRDDQLAFVDWLEREGLYSLNNENDYIGSGSMGYTRDLPGDGYQDGDVVKTHNLWALLESQETVGVGPRQFDKFIFPYQLSIAERFGKVYYGCCEPVHSRWKVLKRIPNLARVSVSPWANQPTMAEACGQTIVFSRKPNPTLISTAHFDEDAIRRDLRETLDAARGCRTEIIMKDVHTLHNEPERLARWVHITREEIEKHS